MLIKEMVNEAQETRTEAKKMTVEATKRRVSEEKVKRLQFDFSPAAYQRLIELRTKSQTRTIAELVRNALRLYEWFLDQKNQGYTIQLVSRDNQVKEVELMF